MTWDRKIDPVAKDYVQTSGGDFEREMLPLATAAYHQLNDTLGAWAGDALAGLDADAVPKKNTSRDWERYANAVRTALQRFEAEGRAADISVTINEADGQRYLCATMRDTSTGEALDLSSFFNGGV